MSSNTLISHEFFRDRENSDREAFVSATDFWPRRPILLKDLLDGRLAKYGIYEIVGPVPGASDCARCLLDIGRNGAAIARAADDGTVKAITTARGGGGGIITAIGEEFRTDLRGERRLG
jgi:hypothetical protein